MFLVFESKLTSQQQVINGFKDIITTVQNDITAMNNDSKRRSLQRRIDCLNIENPEKCLDDLGEIIEDPSEILGDKKKRQAAGYTDSQQQAICTSFRGVST